MTDRPQKKRPVPPETPEGLWDVWYSELHENAVGLTLKVERVLESTESEFQRIDVLENRFYGKLLSLYGSLMVAEGDNNAYNEMISHVPLFSHPKPESVLVIGGGDCGTLTEVLKHREVKRCTMCEIDEKVVEVCKRHFPNHVKGLDDPRANLIFEDGKRFINNSTESFDIILLDLSDPIGPAFDLFQKEFHRSVHDQLADDGILVAQSEAPLLNSEIIQPMYRNLRDIFPIVKMYTCFMPIYPSGYWSFALCSKKHDPLADFKRDRVRQAKLETRYYNEDVHTGSFALPEFIKRIIA